MKMTRKKSAVLMAMMVVLSAGLCGCSNNNEEARMVQIRTSDKEFRFALPVQWRKPWDCWR